MHSVKLAPMSMSDDPSEILPRSILLHVERKGLQPALCQPKLLPIKSFSLIRLEQLERKMELEERQRRDDLKAEQAKSAWSTED